MCAEYLQSAVDSIVVLDEYKRPIGIVGGYDILSHFQRNPTIELQYETKIEQIMFKDFLQVQKETQLKDLMEKWKYTRRAFAVVSNESGGYSTISARKMLEIGKRIKTNLSISSIVKKKLQYIIPFFIGLFVYTSKGDPIHIEIVIKLRKMLGIEIIQPIHII